MTAKSEINLLANYIMANVPGEPSRNEGAGACAVRLLEKYRIALAGIMNELGVPDKSYPAPAANAWEIARKALGICTHQAHIKAPCRKEEMKTCSG